MVRHPAEVLQGALSPLVVAGVEFIASSFGVWMPGISIVQGLPSVSQLELNNSSNLIKIKEVLFSYSTFSLNSILTYKTSASKSCRRRAALLGITLPKAPKKCCVEH